MKIVERTGDILSPVKTEKPYYNDVTICYQANCYGVMSTSSARKSIAIVKHLPRIAAVQYA